MSESHGEGGGTLLLRTPLHDLHVEQHARFVRFAGYEMPVQYPLGVLKEHLHTREAAGLFDVSHMGQIALHAKSGTLSDAALAVEQLVPIDVLGLTPGLQRYAVLTNDQGGILDDLMIANRGDHLLLIVNAATKAADEIHLRQHLSDSCEIEPLDRSLIALQGPAAETALLELAPEVAAMHFMEIRSINLLGAECYVSRSGYTGEDGFEISVAPDRATDLARALLRHQSVAMIGLGARDSLRLEAGLCLYGSDLDATTTPVEANLEWAIQRVRRAGGARQAGFPGAPFILEQLYRGTSRRRTGFTPVGRAPVRAGAEIFATEQSHEVIGCVTSGGFGPSLKRPIAMGYIGRDFAETGRQVFTEVRGQRLPMLVSGLPFVPANFKRKLREFDALRAIR